MGYLNECVEGVQNLLMESPTHYNYFAMSKTMCTSSTRSLWASGSRRRSLFSARRRLESSFSMARRECDMMSDCSALVCAYGMDTGGMWKPGVNEERDCKGGGWVVCVAPVTTGPHPYYMAVMLKAAPGPPSLPLPPGPPPSPPYETVGSYTIEPAADTYVQGGSSDRAQNFDGRGVLTSSTTHWNNPSCGNGLLRFAYIRFTLPPAANSAARVQLELTRLGVKANFGFVGLKLVQYNSWEEDTMTLDSIWPDCPTAAASFFDSFSYANCGRCGELVDTLTFTNEDVPSLLVFDVTGAVKAAVGSVSFAVVPHWGDSRSVSWDFYDRDSESSPPRLRVFPPPSPSPPLLHVLFHESPPPPPSPPDPASPPTPPLLLVSPPPSPPPPADPSPPPPSAPPPSPPPPCPPSPPPPSPPPPSPPPPSPPPLCNGADSGCANIQECDVLTTTMDYYYYYFFYY